MLREGRLGGARANVQGTAENLQIFLFPVGSWPMLRKYIICKPAEMLSIKFVLDLMVELIAVLECLGSNQLLIFNCMGFDKIIPNISKSLFS